MPWYVLITKPRSEKKVAEKLQEKGIEVCCPMSIEVRQWSDRKRKVEVLELTTFGFVKLECFERSKVFENYGAIQYFFGWVCQQSNEIILSICCSLCSNCYSLRDYY